MIYHQVVVFYHANCLDGYAAAWAAWKVLGSTAKYQSVQHGELIPDFPAGATLYILDFCYPYAELYKASKKAAKIVVLDHHQSAEKQCLAALQTTPLPINIELHFEQNFSGGILAWHFFHTDKSPPLILEHIQDHDLWLHKKDNTESICKALFLRLPMPFSLFESLNLSDLQREGDVLVKQQKLNVAGLMKTSHPIKLNGNIGLAVNAPPQFASDLGNALAKKTGTFGMTYFYHGKFKRYQCGLRSIVDFDVGGLAQLFDGGGHKNAAGFSVEREVFDGFLNF